MDWRCLHQYKRGGDVGQFYLTSLTYAHYLWHHATPARAVLALNRGIYAPLQGNEPEYQQRPIPYSALHWLIQQSGSDERFLGNPRISYQHQADRIQGDRKQQRRARAWACWAIARAALPTLQGDAAHPVEEPTHSTISNQLLKYGLPGEAELWQNTLENP